jgi:hypothetical protein
VGLLGGVHGDVGPLQQLLGVGAVVGVDGHPDAGFDVDRQSFEHERLLQAGHELFGHGHRTLAGLDAREQDRELAAAEAGHGVDLAQGGLEPLADLEEELVAVVVAEGDRSVTCR